MKVKEGFVMRKVTDMYVVIPVEKQSRDFHGMIQLNETGMFLWQQLNKECSFEQLIDSLMKEYEVEYDIAKEDVKIVIEKLQKYGILCE